MAEATESKDLAEKADNLPANVMDELYQDAGSGFENTTANDYAIPYLSIAQANSPQLKKQDGKFIKGLEMGNVFDTVEGWFAESVRIIPCLTERFFVEWVPRTEGGGFVARHDISTNILAQTTPNEVGRDILPNGHEIIDTTYMYALVVGEDGINRPVVISFARTSMKKYKKLMTTARNIRVDGPKGPFNPPLYSHVYEMKTVMETSKRSGDDYFNWELEGDAAMVTAEQLTEAKALYDAVKAGQRGAADPEAEAEAADAF